jgi:O-antigen/teichoic acid export membrane protein
MSIREQALRNTLFSSLGIYTEYVLGMLTSIIIARYLGPKDFGAYSMVVWLVAMGVAITNSGTASAAIRFIADLRGGEREELIVPLLAFLRRAQRVFLLVVLIGGGLLFVFAGERLAPGFNHRVLFGFLVLAVGLRSQYMFNIGVAKGFEDFRATALIALVSTPVNLALVIAAWWFHAPVEGLLVVFVVSSALFFVMSHRQARRLMPTVASASALPPDLRARVARHMRMTAMTVTIGFFAASEVEVLFLNLYGNAAGAGQFKVAYQLASGAALLVPGVFGALLLPMMARALSQSREIAGRRFAASTIYLALLAAPLVAFGAVFADSVIGLLYGAAYAQAAPVFALCLFACSVSTVSQGGSSLLISADRQNLVLIVVALCGVLKMTLDATLIAHFGLHGAIFAYVTVSLVAAASMIGLGMRTSGARIEWGRLSRIVLAAAIAAAIAVCLRGHWSPLPTLLIGFVLLSAVYLLSTLLLGCWTREDIGHLQSLHQRFVRGRPRAFARLLAWAGRDQE